MKKSLFAMALATCISAPAFAATTKFFVESPDEPLHRRAIVLCIVVTLVLQAVRRARLPTRTKRH